MNCWAAADAPRDGLFLRLQARHVDFRDRFALDRLDARFRHDAKLGPPFRHHVLAEAI